MGCKPGGGLWSNRVVMVEIPSMASGPGSWVVEDADALLVQRFVRGDASAFDALVARYQPRVAGLAYRLLGWREDAEDVVQEVFLAAMRALPNFRGSSGVGTWLTAITLNKCRSHRRWRRLTRFRRSGRRAAAARESSEEPCADGPADGPAIDRERFERVRRAIERLPASYREVIVLRYLEQMSIERIAEVLSARTLTIQVRLHRARRKLKDQLKDLVRE